ncbi:MAG: hypothetical protein BCS36_00120 [Desulfovibrio sp. MES5]|nr:MAG: hypothetical protein BCS36_00120 [Desulfovibrio sp. MES5]
MGGDRHGAALVQRFFIVHARAVALADASRKGFGATSGFDRRTSLPLMTSPWGQGSRVVKASAFTAQEAAKKDRLSIMPSVPCAHCRHQ